MKKYVKPELFYEHYELSQHIADCAWELQFAAKETCKATADEDFLPGFAGSDYFLFTESAACSLGPPVYEDFCYQNNAPAVSVFKS